MALLRARRRRRSRPAGAGSFRGDNRPVRPAGSAKLGRVQAAGSTSRLMTRLAAAYAAYRQRQVLARLDDRTLADIGLTRTQALAEAARPAWDVPGNWPARWIA